MTHQKRFFFFLILFLFTIALNFIARKKMNFSYADMPGYNQLYQLDDQLRIRKLNKKGNDSLCITFSGNEINDKHNVFKVYYKNGLFTQTKAKELTFKPLTGVNRYFIKINNIADSV